MSKPVFSPIAIVGQGCVLPGACSSAEALWQITQSGHVVLGPSPKKWEGILRVAPPAKGVASVVNGLWSDTGGFVDHFDYRILADIVAEGTIASLDPVFQWSLAAARQAYGQAKIGARTAARTGVVLGNLSYASVGCGEYVAETIVSALLPDAAPYVRKTNPLNRFASGYPAQFIADALHLKGAALALDAACASSLYAIKIACDRLNTGQADCMLAGGVCAADAAFIHVGFCALQAKSATSQSRPFHKDADGLIPAEGAAILALKRLADAQADGDEILGVIQGIGLSNDGGGAGFLVPTVAGQLACMRQAFAMASCTPADVSFVECHATGTSLGDRTEIHSLQKFFGGQNHLALGSLKANLGHLITASGAAGLMKVLQAFRHEVLPPTPNAFPIMPELQSTPFRVLETASPWRPPQDRYVACVSSFGFGGNNAHMIVERYEATRPLFSSAHVALASPQKPLNPLPLPFPLRALAVRTDQASNTKDALLRLFGAGYGDAPVLAHEQVATLPLNGLGSTPASLREALGQQLLLLETVHELLASCKMPLPPKTGVYIGMGVDPEGARHLVAQRVQALLQQAPGWEASSAWCQKVHEQFGFDISADRVVGTMPNICANRISKLWGCEGPGFTVSCEELSGLEALQLAAEALQRGEIECAIVGAVDLCRDKVHENALRESFPGLQAVMADGAVALLLTRCVEVIPELPVLAKLRLMDREAFPSCALTFSSQDTHNPVLKYAGHTHAALGLLHVAHGVFVLQTKAVVDAEGKATPVPLLHESGASVGIHVASSFGPERFVEVQQGDESFAGKPDAWHAIERPFILTYGASSLAQLISDLEQDQRSHKGPYRCSLVCYGATKTHERQQALTLLKMLPADKPFFQKGNFCYSRGPVKGDIASVFTGTASTYRGMDTSILLAFPELLDHVGEGFRRILLTDFLALSRDPHFANNAAHQLWVSSAVSQMHAAFLKNILGLTPDMTFGLSSGETNTLFAYDVWHTAQHLFEELNHSNLYLNELSGSYNAVKTFWGVPANQSIAWESWVVHRPLGVVEEALQHEERVYMTIIYTDNAAMISGEAAACQRVLDKLGRSGVLRVEQDLAIHCPAVTPFAQTWQRLHMRPTTPNPSLRFYANYFGGVYTPTEHTAAEALTGQALQTISLPKIARKVWEDGARIFIEHGPRNALTSYMDSIFQNEGYYAVAFDRPDVPSAVQATRCAARLWVASVPVNLDKLQEPCVQQAGPLMSFPLHPKPIYENTLVYEQPAPQTPLVLEQPVLLAYQQRIGHSHAQFLSSMYESQALFLEVMHNMVLPLEPLPPEPSQPGVLWDYHDLVTLASGRISDVFGPLFAEQDQYAVQCRMPEPPLLLAHRVTGIEGEPRSMGKGVIYTESDVTADSWYLHNGRMPAGILIESGQADLLLMSWLGVDFHNKGERSYRLLGCKMEFLLEAPKVGDTLRYEIHVDGHARHGDVLLFFFHYDAYINGQYAVRMREGQAGFFTKEELAESRGVVWSPQEGPYQDSHPLPVPRVPVAAIRTSFTEENLLAFCQGDIVGCFGEAYAWTQTHTRTPTYAKPFFNFLKSVPCLDIQGGPAGRGYLRVDCPVDANDWFFAGHFKNDPCMPGTLMAEGCVQLMAFYLTALGYTLDKDGWRFEPAREAEYSFVCRGQVTPQSQLLTYELFVDEITADPYPTLWCHTLCTVDGLKAFLCRRFSVRLVPDFPLSSLTHLLADFDPAADSRPVATVGGVSLDFASLMHCALGDPRHAFHPKFPFKDYLRLPRLPGPPYHFMTRISSVSTDFGELKAGARVEALYDMPPDAWYFQENGGAMPLCVLMEVALQPCGWLASYAGCAFGYEGELLFRNLDGKAFQSRLITAHDKTVRTVVEMTSCSKFGTTTIVAFSLQCFCGEEAVFTVNTSFGFFLPEAMRDQKGLPETPRESTLGAYPDNTCLALGPNSGPAFDVFFAHSAHLPLPGSLLLLINRITAAYLSAEEGSGDYFRAEMDVAPAQWFFKAHFYQDPVQPGSLGVEAMMQLLQASMLLRGYHTQMTKPVFHPIFFPNPQDAGAGLAWQYRGQVVPSNQVVTVELEVLRVVNTTSRVDVFARAWLRVDGLKIYHMPHIGMILIDTGS